MGGRSEAALHGARMAGGVDHHIVEIAARDAARHVFCAGIGVESMVRAQRVLVKFRRSSRVSITDTSATRALAR